MIDVTHADTSNIRQHSVKDTQKQTDPLSFAKSLEDASKKSNNGRESTGKTAGEPVKGQGRREWAHQRSRADSKSKGDDNVESTTPDVDNPEQDQSLSAEDNLLMWFMNMPAELNDEIALSTEKNPMISEETINNILLWMQSMPEVDNLPEELTAIIDKTQEWLQAQNDLSQVPLSTDQNTELTAFLGQLKSIIEANVEANVENVTPKESVHDKLGLTVIAAEESYKNISSETDSKNETTKQSEVKFTNDINIGSETPAEDVTTNLSDHHFSKKDFTPSDTSAEFTAQEKSDEPVIPFSLAQIDTLLQQNTMINQLDQQQTQIKQEVLQQVIDKIQVTHGTNQSFVTLHLVPEHLGKLTIQLTSDIQHGMTARIYAETPHAKEMIESNFGQLKDALSGKGVNLTAMEVFVGQDPESSEKQREFQYQQARAQRRRGSRVTNVSNTERKGLISEIPITGNPYVLTEGFDQLG